MKSSITLTLAIAVLAVALTVMAVPVLIFLGVIGAPPIAPPEALNWMAWTWASAAFFAFVIAMLVMLTLLAVYRPETPRVGILRFPTTRGDRFFVTMIGSFFIFIFWMRFGGGALWYPLAASVIYGIAMFRFA